MARPWTKAERKWAEARMKGDVFFFVGMVVFTVLFFAWITWDAWR